MLIARYPLNPKNPTRRVLGDYGKITLEQARGKAREWLAWIGKGVQQVPVVTTSPARNVIPSVRNSLAHQASATRGSPSTLLP